MANTKIPVELSSTPGIVDNSDATAITIDSSENVGIGTSSPATHLHLESAGATQLRIRTTSSSSEPQMLMIDGAGDYFAMQKVDKGMTFKPQGGEAMRINDSGNIGIGTTTINSATLGPNNTFVEVAAGTASGSGTLVLSRDSSTNDVELGGIRFVNANNADDDGLDADGKMVAAISARSITSDSNAGDDSGADLTFSTKPEAGNFSERMRIDSAGRFGFSGTYPPTSAQFMRIEEEFSTNRIVRMANRDNSGNSNTFEVGHADNNEGAHVIIAYHGNNTSGASGDPYNDAIMSLQVNGNMGIDGTLSQGSDRRLKKDIANSTYGLAAINQLIPRTYKHRDVSKEMIGTQIGFIADEVESVIPEVVSKFGLKADGSTLSKSITGYGDEAGTEQTFDNVKTLNYERLVVVLTKALQEADDKIEALTARIETLEGGE